MEKAYLCVLCVHLCVCVVCACVRVVVTLSARAAGEDGSQTECAARWMHRGSCKPQAAAFKLYMPCEKLQEYAIKAPLTC